MKLQEKVIGARKIVSYEVKVSKKELLAVMNDIETRYKGKTVVMRIN